MWILRPRAGRWDSGTHVTPALGNTPVLADSTPAADRPLQHQQREAGKGSPVQTGTLRAERPEEMPAEELAMTKKRQIFDAPQAVTA